MSKPNNSINKIKLPGENTGRPIVPYYLGVSSSNNYVATLPALTADAEFIINKLNQTIDGAKTFTNTVTIEKSSGNALVISKDALTPPLIITYNKITTGAGAGNLDISLGTSGRLLDDYPSSDVYGVKMPSTSSWTADKTIATTDQIVTIISADWEEVQMITFTVQGSFSSLGTWSVPAGTTWGDLDTCYSSTSSSYYITGNTIYFVFNNSSQIAGTISTNGQNNGDVSLTDAIVNGTTYYARTAQSGGADN